MCDKAGSEVQDYLEEEKDMLNQHFQNEFLRVMNQEQPELLASAYEILKERSVYKICSMMQAECFSEALEKLKKMKDFNKKSNKFIKSVIEMMRKCTQKEGFDY